jgi:hypothetical protein
MENFRLKKCENQCFVETLVFVDALGCFAPATAATPRGDITGKCLPHISLIEGASRISTEHPMSLRLIGEHGKKAGGAV